MKRFVRRGMMLAGVPVIVFAIGNPGSGPFFAGADEQVENAEQLDASLTDAVEVEPLGESTPAVPDPSFSDPAVSTTAPAPDGSYSGPYELDLEGHRKQFLELARQYSELLNPTEL